MKFKKSLSFCFYLLIPVFLLSYTKANSKTQSEAKIKKRWSHSSNLRKSKKMALGLGAASIFGLYGASLELSLNDQTSFQIGFGNAPMYQTFHSQFIKTMPGKRFSPYFAGGYSTWYTNRKDPHRLKKITPSFLPKRFLKNSDFEKGSFSEHIVYTSLGLQYLQIQAPWTGLAFYGEANLLINVDDFISALTGGLGLKYYF